MQNILHFCQYSRDVCVCVRVRVCACVRVCVWVCAVIPLLCLVSSLLFNRHCLTSQHNSLWLSVSYKPCSSNSFQFPKLVAYFEVWQAKDDSGKNFLGSVENVERDAHTVIKRVTSLNWVIQLPLTHRTMARGKMGKVVLEDNTESNQTSLKYTTDKQPAG